MITNEFEFRAPTDLQGVLEAIAERPYGTKLLAGGMSLVPMMNLGLTRPEIVLSLSRVAELVFVDESRTTVRIGSMTKHRDVVANEILLRECGMLSEAARGIGDVQVRNRGTLGGSLAHGDPAADYLPVLCAYRARCEVASRRGSRWIDADALLVDIMQTSLELDEVVVQVEVPKRAQRTGSAFARFVRVEGNYAIVTAAAVATQDSVRVVVGGATATPIAVEVQMEDTQAVGAHIVDELETGISEGAADAYGDAAGGADYRRAMARVFGRRVAEQALTSFWHEGGTA